MHYSQIYHLTFGRKEERKLKGKEGKRRGDKEESLEGTEHSADITSIGSHQTLIRERCYCLYFIYEKTSLEIHSFQGKYITELVFKSRSLLNPKSMSPFLIPRISSPATYFLT